MGAKRLALMGLSVALLGSGCATVVNGRHQCVTITSDPPGAKVETDAGVDVNTPGSVNLVRNKNHVLVATYGGCAPQQKELSHELSGWIFGNILIGGIIGAVVDVASGSCYKLVPGKVHFDFPEVGQANAPPRGPALPSPPGPDQETRVEGGNEPAEKGIVEKGMTKGEVIAAMGQPSRVVRSGEYEGLIYENRTPHLYFFEKGILRKTK